MIRSGGEIEGRFVFGRERTHRIDNVVSQQCLYAAFMTALFAENSSEIWLLPNALLVVGPLAGISIGAGRV